MRNRGTHRARTRGVTTTGGHTLSSGDVLTTVPVVTCDFGGGTLPGHPGGGLFSRFAHHRHGGLELTTLEFTVIETELLGAGDLATGQIKRAGDAVALLVGGTGDSTLVIALLLSGTGGRHHTEACPGRTFRGLAMAVGARWSLVATGRGELVCTYIGGAGDGFTGSLLITRHHTTHTGLDAGHGSRRRTKTHRSAFANGLNSRSSAVLASIFESGIGGASDGLTGAWFIACDSLGATRAGATHHLIAVGDAEADLGGFRLRFATAEGIDLFSADVLIAGDAMARTKLITGHLGGATHQGSCHTRPREGSRLANLGGRATVGEGI